MPRSRSAIVLVTLALFAASTPVVAESDTATVVDYATTDTLGAAAARFVIVAATEVTCTMRAELSGAGSNEGTRSSLLHVESPVGRGWIHSSGGPIASAHAEGLVDTRDFASTHGSYGASGITIRNATFEGAVTFTAAGTNVAPWPEGLRERWPFPGPAPGEHAIRFQATCDGPVTTTLTGSREMALMHARNGDGGIGADVFFVGNVNVGDHAGGTTTGGETIMMADAFGLQAGTLDLSTPEGDSSWRLTPASSGGIAYSGGPGDHRITLHRVGLEFDVFWALLAGMHTLTALDDIAVLPSW